MKLSLRQAAPFFSCLFLAPLFGEEPGKAPIWKISDADSTVYLAGSIHLLREKDLPLPAAFDQVYAAAEELVFEIDMARMLRPEGVQEMASAARLPDGQSLVDRLGEDTVARLRDYLESRDLPRSLFDRMTPSMALLTLGSLEAMRLGGRAELGLESTYFQKSVADGKPSRGLETITYQITLFDRFEDAQIASWIHKTLDELENSAALFESLLVAWRQGDAETMAQRLSEDAAMPPELRRVLLDERNRNWIPEILKALATERDVLFLVGAGHLAGEGSVIDLLRKEGLEVTQLANPQ